MKTKEAYQQGLRTYLILKNYSPATVSAYGCAFHQFFGLADSAEIWRRFYSAHKRGE